MLMDENYILLPHGVNFQEAIFPDTQENRRMFASLFQFSNCSQAQHVLSFSSDWEIQEDNRDRPLVPAHCQEHLKQEKPPVVSANEVMFITLWIIYLYLSSLIQTCTVCS
ncbi:hypothetical protein IHE44_0012626 [Lamprotornis superbus]|uniref:Coiled-coil domain-containing protein 3 n=1 Tax=Lamprotornis superbus TaxID=245042 RepID=A0A835TW16_9PASS|nr:hypothetical protein IHE44_0012626 [Lamprotornis superbus]